MRHVRSGRSFSVLSMPLVFVGFMVLTYLFRADAASGSQVVETFDVSGQWTAPANVTSVIVEAWGGGGGAALDGTQGGGGGGGGAYARSRVPVSPGTTYAVFVGVGGAPGGPGAASYFADGSLIQASGGAAGSGASGGEGGTASASVGNQAVYEGGRGGNGKVGGGAAASRGGGGGGGSADSSQAGADGASGATGLAGRGGIGAGTGGAGGVGAAPQGYGNPGLIPGGGGGGSGGGANLVPGSGASGLLRISYGDLPERPLNASAPTITGIADVGNTLSATPGIWLNAPTWFTFDWLRCDAQGLQCLSLGIAEDTYRLEAGDLGTTLVVEVTATNGGGSSEPVRSEAIGPVAQPPVPPVNTELPAISGQPLVGGTLVVSLGSWSNEPTYLSVSWLRCNAGGQQCEPIGVHSVGYLATDQDLGSRIRVDVTASNAAGNSLPARSAATDVITAPLAIPTNTSPPVIEGIARTGSTLTATPGDWSNSPTSFSFSWLRCDVSGSACSTVGSTASTYPLGTADLGTTLRVDVTAMNADGSSGAARSAPTGTVSAGTEPPADVPSEPEPPGSTILEIGLPPAGIPALVGYTAFVTPQIASQIDGSLLVRAGGAASERLEASFSVRIPEGAVQSAQWITVRTANPMDAAAATGFDRPASSLGAAFQVSGLDATGRLLRGLFIEPAEITIELPADLVTPWSIAGHYQLCYWSGSSWNDLPGEVLLTADHTVRVRATVDRFGLFAIMVRAPGLDPAPTPGSVTRAVWSGGPVLNIASLYPETAVVWVNRGGMFYMLRFGAPAFINKAFLDSTAGGELGIDEAVVIVTRRSAESWPASLGLD